MQFEGIWLIARLVVDLNRDGRRARFDVDDHLTVWANRIVLATDFDGGGDRSAEHDERFAGSGRGGRKLDLVFHGDICRSRIGMPLRRRERRVGCR